MLGLNPPKSGRHFCTIREAFSRDSAYWGASQEWYVVAAVNRDSDTLDESNFSVLRARLGESAKIERANHWACGWVDYLIISPNDRRALRIAIEANKACEDYPVLDEEHFSNLEYEKFWEYAASELKAFDMWEHYLSNAMQESNSGPGDAWAESKIIEVAREQLEEREEMIERAASSSIDPAQLTMFGVTDCRYLGAQ
jgi:hypothetical protein